MKIESLRQLLKKSPRALETDDINGFKIVCILEMTEPVSASLVARRLVRRVDEDIQDHILSIKFNNPSLYDIKFGQLIMLYEFFHTQQNWIVLRNLAEDIISAIKSIPDTYSHIPDALIAIVCRQDVFGYGLNNVVKKYLKDRLGKSIAKYTKKLK